MLDKNDGADSADTPDRGRIATGVETGTAPGDVHLTGYICPGAWN